MGSPLDTSFAPVVRLVSHAAFELRGHQAFDGAIQDAVHWMRRQNASIPQSAFSGQPFSVGGGGIQPAQAVRIDGEGSSLWAAQIDFDDHTVPEARRTWTTELSIGRSDGRVAFGARLFNFTAGEDRWFDPTRPAVIRRVISNHCAVADGVELSTHPVNVDEAGFEDFWRLLLRKDRSLPIVAISQNENGNCWVEPGAISKRVCGVAHVFILSRGASWLLSERAAKINSVYNGAIRVYRPGFDPDGEFDDHPVWMFRDDLLQLDIDRRLDRLIAFVFGSLRRSLTLREFPRFSELQRAAAARRSLKIKESGAKSDALIPLYEEEIASLQKALQNQKSEYDSLLTSADQDTLAARHEAEEAKQELHWMRSRLRSVEAALVARGEQAADEPLNSFADIEEWSAKHLSGAIWIAPKAMKETIKNGVFSDPQLFGRTLLALRDFMVPMRRSPGGAMRNAYEDKLTELRLEDLPCFGNPDNVHSDPAYSLMYAGEKYWCANHIKHGGGLDPRYFFRIYYAWHEAEQIVLIGHMPTHLDNKITN